MNHRQPLHLPIRTIRLLTLDAFGTIFHPKQPIAQQYLAEARRHALLQDLTERETAASFRDAFRVQLKKYPNYGKAVGMGAQEWWANVITSTFTPYLPPSTPLPKPLIPALLHRFSTSSGYALYPDILPFLHRVRTSKPDSPIIIGVVSNSDDRVPGILSSLGLRVGGVRWGMEGREVVGDVAGEENGNVEKEGEERHDTTSPKANNPPQPNDDNDDISFIALSYDINSEKPNRGIFNAARQLGEHCLLNHHHYHSPITINNNTCIHIGDDMEKDYKGAKNAGWDAVLLDRNRDWDGIEKGDESKVEEMGIGKGKVARASGLGDLVFY